MMQKEYEEAGEITRLFRYPVKSMAGESLQTAKVGWHGLAGDRRYAFQIVGNHTGLPWLSAREVPKLVTYRAKFDSHGTTTDDGLIAVTTPEGNTLPLESPELLANLEALARFKLMITQLWRGTFDSMDVSLITEQSIAGIASAAQTALEPERFRPNILVRARSDRPWPEERWIGELLVLGQRADSARLRINRKDVRCRVPAIDPFTGEGNPAVVAEIIRARKNLLGVYASVERPGTVATGDQVYVLKN